MYSVTKKLDIANVALVSIAGGFRDTLIREDNTWIHDIVGKENGFSVSSYAVPGVGVSADHQCIVWCKQLIQKIAATIGELVSHPMNPSESFSLPLHKRMQILRSNLASTAASKFGIVKNTEEFVKAENVQLVRQLKISNNLCIRKTL